MPHARGKRSGKKWKERIRFFDDVNYLVSSLSLHDYVRKEKIFCLEREGEIRRACQEAFGFVPGFATDHEFGEVLNSRR